MNREDSYQEKGPMKRERSWRSGGGEGPSSKRVPGGPMPSTLRVLLRSIDAGGIIGKGGENIKRLRKKYDCQVQLPDSSGNPERVLTVIGEQNNCVGVFQECLEKVRNEVRRRDSHAPLEIQVLIPQPFMGTIIGTGGTKIKDLRKRSSANIKIFSEPMPYSNERSISLSGTEEQIVNCVTFFLQEIGQREPKEPIILYDPSLPPEMPPHYDYPPPSGPGGYVPPPHYGKRGGGGRGRGRDGQMSHEGRGRGRFSPSRPSQSGGMNYQQTPDGRQSGPDSVSAPPTNGPSPSASQTPNVHPPSQESPSRQQPSQGPPPPVVQYPQSTGPPPSQSHGSGPSYPPPAGQNTQPYGNYMPPPPNAGSYPPPPIPPQAPPTGGAPLPLVPQVGGMQSQQAPPGNNQQYQAPPMGPPPNYPPAPPSMQPSSYSNYPSGYPAPQTNYPSNQYSSNQGSYQQSYSNPQPSQSYPHNPAYPSQQQHNMPPTQPNYGYASSSQYQQGPPPVFPAAVAMSTGYQGGSDNQQSSKQVTIPNEYAGAILGHSGSKLQQIRTQSQCNITMDEPGPGSTQRIITIVGTSANIAIAEQLMKDSVRQQHKI